MEKSKWKNENERKKMEEWKLKKSKWKNENGRMKMEE